MEPYRLWKLAVTSALPARQVAEVTSAFAALEAATLLGPGSYQLSDSSGILLSFQLHLESFLVTPHRKGLH